MDTLSKEGSKQFPKLLSVDNVCELFSVSRATVYRLVESRLIPCYRIGRFLRFKEDEVLAYLESQKVKSRDEWFYVAPHKSHPQTPKTPGAAPRI